ncbi:GIY-YIG nuclease family protein [Brachybacterium sp. J144]|uniref:GIY-YIG nuclease family protein n=1 Tax=Brachybacterium sp. J144 TaxID=3116487 RepID=UPI002E79E30F|nr:GIY-YIG nuclease family protein [Brachybacterium sp. J144]MEE1651382.1 GIY-YIG nuclease family protein [Brachybacterium sp. J144]
MTGKQVRLFLVDGKPGGLMTAEIGNWTGHVLKGKRLELGEIRTRPEASRTGIYILFGTGDDDERVAYIGESDNVGKRLVDHDAKKDFWDEVVIVTSKDANFTSAHVRYLESRLVRIAKDIGRIPLVNIQGPTGGADLPEADASDMDYFIDQVRILMPVLGHDIFRGRATAQSALAGRAEGQTALELEQVAPDSPAFFLRATKGMDARAQVIDGEFTLLEGSIVSSVMRRSEKQAASTARQFENRSLQHADLMKVVEPLGGGELGRVLKDVVYSSPSAAAAVVLGRASANGRIEWVDELGKSYGAWEAAQAER